MKRFLSSIFSFSHFREIGRKTLTPGLLVVLILAVIESGLRIACGVNEDLKRYFPVQGTYYDNPDPYFVYDAERESWSAEKFLGDCYGGRVLGDAVIAKAGEGAVLYQMQAGFHKVDLQRFLAAGKEASPAEKTRTAGTMSARLSMGATVGAGGVRMGVCKLDIVEMQVGKVSPLGKLLSVLSLTEPSDYAFERLLVDSYIKRVLL